jgi:hypothetical protein
MYDMVMTSSAMSMILPTDTILSISSSRSSTFFLMSPAQEFFTILATLAM